MGAVSSPPTAVELVSASTRSFDMPRASWKGFLRLSLVSCPVYLSPATTRTKPIRLHQVWVPRSRAPESEAEGEDEPVRRSGVTARYQEPEIEAGSQRNARTRRQHGSLFSRLTAKQAKRSSATRS